MTLLSSFINFNILYILFENFHIDNYVISQIETDFYLPFQSVFLSLSFVTLLYWLELLVWCWIGGVTADSRHTYLVLSLTGRTRALSVIYLCFCLFLNCSFSDWEDFFYSRFTELFLKSGMILNFLNSFCCSCEWSCFLFVYKSLDMVGEL